MSPATVVYPEVIAGLTHKPLPRRRRVVNNRRAATEGRRTQTQISIKVKDGCAVEQELLIDTSLIHEEAPKREEAHVHGQTLQRSVCVTEPFASSCYPRSYQLLWHQACRSGRHGSCDSSVCLSSPPLCHCANTLTNITEEL